MVWSWCNLEFDNREYQVRVSGAPYQDGNEWVYTCFIADGQSNSYIPGEYLLAGRQVSRLASAYEEYSEEGDILNYNTHFKMRNFLFTTRLDYDITGTAYSTVLWIALKDPKLVRLLTCGLIIRNGRQCVSGLRDVRE